jgi:hypothetical protein
MLHTFVWPTTATRVSFSEVLHFSRAENKLFSDIDLVAGAFCFLLVPEVEVNASEARKGTIGAPTNWP